MAKSFYIYIYMFFFLNSFRGVKRSAIGEEDVQNPVKKKYKNIFIYIDIIYILRTSSLLLKVYILHISCIFAAQIIFVCLGGGKWSPYTQRRAPQRYFPTPARALRLRALYATSRKQRDDGRVNPQWRGIEEE